MAITKSCRCIQTNFPQEDLQKGMRRFAGLLAVRQFGERIFRWVFPLLLYCTMFSMTPLSLYFFLFFSSLSCPCSGHLLPSPLLFLLCPLFPPSRSPFPSDLVATWWMICMALLGASVLSFVWILLMRFLTGSYVLHLALSLLCTVLHLMKPTPACSLTNLLAHA